MDHKALLSTVLVATLATGCCLLPRGDRGPKDHVTAGLCKDRECKVAVNVAACVITVDPEWLGVAKGNRDVTITWEIQHAPGVTFAKEGGIFFKEADREAASRQFSKPGPAGEDKFRWSMANNQPGLFHYGVRVVDNGKPCPVLDPTIVAEM
jgi:hypothetical protein